MEAESQIGIERPQTEFQKADFIPITTKNPEATARSEIIQKINRRNRSLLLKSKDSDELLKNIKNLSCFSCFEIEHRQNLASDEFESEFTKFKGRLKFKQIDKTYNKNGLQYEKGINIWFNKCPYCAKNQCISIQGEEMTEELYKSLFVLASKSDGEV